MSAFLLFVTLSLAQAGTTGPAETVLAALSKAGDRPKAEVVKPYIDPKGGLTVDTAVEGSNTPKWVTVTQANVDQHFAKVLLPLFQEGLFKATPGCSLQGQKIACTLMTATSMPRTLEFVVVGGKAYMSKLYWSPSKEDDDEDDDLPM